MFCAARGEVSTGRFSFLGRTLKMRILAIDYGTVRVGTAISDEIGMIATPFRLLPYSREVVQTIATIVAEESIGEVVVGVPFMHDGRETLTTRQAENFAARLRTILPCPVVEWDEAFSSRRAGERMIEAGVPKSKRRKKGNTDTWAAAIVLQDYLDSRRPPPHS